MSIFHRFDWKYVTLLHGGSETDRSLFWNFVETAKERKICIAKSLVIKPNMPISELTSLFSEELDPNGDSKVIVLLLDDPLSMENVLEAAKQSTFLRDFVWIRMESEKDSRHTARILQGTLHHQIANGVCYTFFTVFINNALLKITVILLRTQKRNRFLNYTIWQLKTFD